MPAGKKATEATSLAESKGPQGKAKTGTAKATDGSKGNEGGNTKTAAKDSAANNNGGENSAGGQRTTFRPPWVKEGPSPLPVPATPWQLNKRGSKDSGKAKEEGEENAKSSFQMPQLRKTSQSKITPIQENGSEVPKKEHGFVKPQLRPVPKPEYAKIFKDNEDDDEDESKRKPDFVKPQLKPVPPKSDEAKLQSKEVKIPIKLNSVKDRMQREESQKRAPLLRSSQVNEDEPIDKATPTTRNALLRQESMKKLSGAPTAPPMPPPAPAMPKLIETKPLNEQQLQKLEALKSRPKVRPDWTGLLKEVERGKKLKHVECNDRSKPLLPKVKAKEGQFLYESEKDNAHNALLKEIQQGIHLKKVKTNDRSKPILEGLRKFRRQMTIEEQIQKSVSMASIAPEEIADEADEMDDIDKIRDDLQSTKQLLAFELRNKEAQERENKKLLLKIQNLEAELEKERASKKSSGQNAGSSSSEADEKGFDFSIFPDENDILIKSLKSEADQARKMNEELEKKYNTAAEQLDSTKSEVEDLKRQKQELEKKLQAALQGKRPSLSERKDSIKPNESEEENYYEDSESESDGEDTEEKREKKVQRELKMLRNKLRSFKNKEDNAKKERIALKEILKKTQVAMKEEKKKYKSLQKEVNKISAMMKDSSDEDAEDEEDEEKEESEEESESETETETESETESDDDSGSEKSVSESEDAPPEKKKENLEKRAKRHENILAALKKGNYVLKTNAERLQDDLNKQKEDTAQLQEDLDSVLSELG